MQSAAIFLFVFMPKGYPFAVIIGLFLETLIDHIYETPPTIHCNCVLAIYELSVNLDGIVIHQRSYPDWNEQCSYG